MGNLAQDHSWVAVRILAQQGLHSCEGMTGAGDSASKMAYSHGCWHSASSSGTVHRSLDVLKRPMLVAMLSRQLMCPGTSNPRESKEATMAFMI